MLLADSSYSAASGVLLGLIVVPIAIAVYFLPTIIAMRRHHAYKNIILGLNIFAFTGFFWLAAFIWAVWPSDKSIADPILGNVTGTGTRNVGDTAGAVAYGTLRGTLDEHQATNTESPISEVIDSAANAVKSATGAVAGWIEGARDDKRNDSVLDQLGKLADLRASGALTEEEFQEMKSKLMRG